MTKRLISFILSLCVFVSGICFAVSAAPVYGITERDVGDYTADGLKGSAVLPEQYSSYDLKPAVLSGPQDQLSTSTCWTFVQNELIQANVAKKTGKLYDFSEQTMKFETSLYECPEWGYDRLPNDGGNEFISTAYLARTGSALEKDEPFNESTVRAADADTLARYGHLEKTLFFDYGVYDPDRYGASAAEIQQMYKNKGDAITKIKELIMEYGAVGSGLYYEATRTYEDENHSNYCYTGNVATPDHSVTIVGWDDNYSASRFVQGEKLEGDGAFIVKNSWGKYHNGKRTCYVYVSYYDKLITSQFFVSEYDMDNSMFDNIYQYDEYGWTLNGFVQDNTVTCVTKFNADKLSEQLSAVSAYVTNGGTQMDVLVNVSGDIDESRLYKKVASVYCEDAGYYFFDFEPISLDRSEYYVAIRYTVSGDTVEFPMQGNVNDFVVGSQNIENTCFVGSSFADLTPLEKLYRNAKTQPMHCIKSYTLSTEDTTPPSGKKFTDVESGKWYTDEVEYCVSHGIFSGTGDTTFEPQTAMTRAMFVTVLANLSGEEIWVSDTPFTDVGKNKWYTDEVSWAYKNNIVSGMTETTFRPNTPVTREQMCFMLIKFCSYKGIALRQTVNQRIFTDADFIHNYAKDAVSLCQMSGIISGMTDGSFAPAKSATRAEVAVLLTGLAKNYIY